MTRLTLLLMSSLAVAGCAMPSSVSVLGAYFPDWLFCGIAGLVLTLLVRSLSIQLRHERTLGPPLLVLPALMLLFSLLVWLLAF